MDSFDDYDFMVDRMLMEPLIMWQVHGESTPLLKKNLP